MRPRPGGKDKGRRQTFSSADLPGQQQQEQPEEDQSQPEEPMGPPSTTALRGRSRDDIGIRLNRGGGAGSGAGSDDGGDAAGTFSIGVAESAKRSKGKRGRVGV